MSKFEFKSPRDEVSQSTFNPHGCTIEELEDEIRRQRGRHRAYLLGILDARIMFMSVGVGT